MKVTSQQRAQLKQLRVVSADSSYFCEAYLPHPCSPLWLPLS